jgi:hypothetical protein
VQVHWSTGKKHLYKVIKALYTLITRHPFSLVSVVLFTLLILQRECHHCPPCLDISDIDTSINQHIDKLWLTRTEYLPAPLPDTIIQHDTVFPDTSSALKDYASLKIYHRSLLNDSSGIISLTDSIQFNSIKGSQFSAHLFQKHTTETITHTIIQELPPKNKLFVGFTIGASYPLKPILAPQLVILTKKDHLYAIAYDPFNKAASIGLLWKISFPSGQH